MEQEIRRAGGRGRATDARPLRHRHPGSWRSVLHDARRGVAIHRESVASIVAKRAGYLADAERYDRQRSYYEARAQHAKADGASELYISMWKTNAALSADAADDSRRLAANLADGEPVARAYLDQAIERVQVVRARARLSRPEPQRRRPECRRSRQRRHRSTTSRPAAKATADPDGPEPPGRRRASTAGGSP